MLALIVSNQSLDIPDDLTISLVFHSPIFFNQGGYSYPFRIPSTHKNRNILNFIHRVESNSDKYQDFDCTVTWDGIIIHRGVLRVKIADENWYEGSIYVEDGKFYYNMKDMYIQQYDLGEREFEDSDEALSYFNDCKGLFYPDREFALPEIFNDLFFEPPSVNVYQLYYNKYWGSEDGGVLVLKQPGTEIRTILIPFFFMKYALPELFLQLGYKLNDQLFFHSDYNKLVIYNSANCNDPTTLINYINHLIYRVHLPRVSITDFIKGIEAFWCCRFFINEKKKQVTLIPLKDVVLNGSAIDFTKNIISKVISLDDKVTGYGVSMAGDPDDDYYSDMADLEREAFNKFKESVENFEDLPPWPVSEITEKRYVINKDNYYYLDSNKNWRPFLPEFFPPNLGESMFLHKNPSESITSPLSTLTMMDNEMICGNKFSKWLEATSRVLFVDLLQGENGSKMVGRLETSNFSLNYGGENGLFEKYFKDYMDWRISTIRVEIQKQMDYVELAEFDFSRKYRILGMVYIVSELSVTLSKNEIKPAKLICYTCP